MIGDTHIRADKSMSFASKPQVKQVRKRLLFILGICLGIVIADAITVVTDSANKNQADDAQPGTKIGAAFISILLYAFGLFVVHRYYEIGLRVFAWLGVIWLIIAGVAILTLNHDFLPGFPAAKSTVVHDDINIDGIIFYGISAILCLAVVILTIIIIILAFKLASLFADNDRSTDQEI